MNAKLRIKAAVVLLSAVLSACTRTAVVPSPSRLAKLSYTPASTPILQPSQTPTSKKTITFTPSLTSTRIYTKTPAITQTTITSPTADLSTLQGVFSAYPLEVGQERVYEVNITYAISFTEQTGYIYDVWHGQVHEQVTRQYTTLKGVGFDLYYPDYPRVSTFPFGGGKFEERTIKLEYRPDGIYDDQGNMEYPIPLEKGKEWPAFGDDSPWYKWSVWEIEDVSTPAGRYEDCALIGLVTGPDTTQKWFCNGVGPARLYAWHHPAIWIMEWLLANIQETKQ